MTTDGHAAYDGGVVQSTELLDRVRDAQHDLGTGDPADALEAVEPLLSATADAVRGPGFLRASPPERARLIEAFCYARVTAVLALEAVDARQAVPRIRTLAGEALEVATPDNAAWKALCAAAEMLGRSGDADGAVWAVEAARRLVPQEDYVIQLRGSLRSMFPGAFAEPR